MNNPPSTGVNSVEGRLLAANPTFFTPATVDIIGHELRTPLAYILGYGKMLENDGLGPLSPEQTVAISSILKGAHDLLSLTEQVTALMLVQANSFSLTPTDLAQLIAETMLPFMQTVEHTGHALIVDLPRTISLIAGDAFLLRQMVAALVDNALKFTPSSGEIEICVAETDDAIGVSISDTGIGIAPGELSRVFELFYQVDHTPTRPYGGLGLGLAVVKAVVERHNGRIQFASEPGQGTQVAVWVPKLSSNSDDTFGGCWP